MTRRTTVAAGLAAVALAAGGSYAVTEGLTGDDDPRREAAAERPVDGPLPRVPLRSTTTCPAPTATVTTSEELTAALESAGPGASIRLADGDYPGRFLVRTRATAAEPAFLCGGPGAVLDGGGPKGGYALHLDGAAHWRLVGFTVRNAQKGVMTDAAVGNVLEHLTVTDIGDEAVHLRRASTDNVVRGTTIRRTGLRKPKFGEGVYVGSAESNWCEISDCRPDRSDRNVVEGNDIAETTSESVDAKEGTSRGIVRGNVFSGAGMTGADSWVDVKGNGWLVTDNRGTDAPEDGFQTHEVLDGWGADNAFSGNRATVNGPGYAINVIGGALGNRVACDNEATAAGAGLSNVPCTSHVSG